MLVAPAKPRAAKLDSGECLSYRIAPELERRAKPAAFAFLAGLIHPCGLFCATIDDCGWDRESFHPACLK